MIGWFKAKSAVTQKDYITAKLPGNFMFINRIPFMINVVFVSLSLSSGFPILLLCCSLSMFVMFLVEKKLFISYSLKPPLYTEKIAKMMYRLMLFSCFLHCLFAIYIYGETDIFPNDINLVKVDDYLSLDFLNHNNSFINELVRRLAKSPFFVILALLTFISFFLEMILSSLSSTNLKKKFLKDFNNSIEGDYFDNFQLITYNDLPRYDFRLLQR